MPDHSNVAGRLWSAAAGHGTRTAVVEREGVTDYAALGARAASFCDALTRHRVAADDRVATFLDRGPDGAAALFAAHAVGAIAVVVNERYRPRQIEHVLRHSGAKVLITSRAMLDRLHREVASPAVVLDVADVAPAPSAASFEPVRRIPSDLAQIIYTSGSTGLPKGVVFTHGALQAGIDSVSGYLGLDGSDRVASVLPFSSVYGMNQLLTAVASGAALIVEPSPLPAQLVAGLAEMSATVLAAVPPLWAQLLTVPAFEEGALANLRVAQNAGGHLPPALVQRIRRALPRTRFYLQYGMTETFRSTYLPPEELERRPDSMGRAMPGTEILLLDEDGRPVPPSVVGEVVHRGPTIALGYWNDPEATRRTFRPNPMAAPGTPEGERVVFSGDLARRDAEGFLYYVGRRSRMIKSMGLRVGPDEVADALYASGEVLEVVIDGEPDAARGERIVAYLVLREGGSLERLARFCRAELPAHEQPTRWMACERLPRLASGKYDLEALRLSAAGSRGAGQEGVLATGSAEA